MFILHECYIIEQSVIIKVVSSSLWFSMYGVQIQ